MILGFNGWPDAIRYLILSELCLTIGWVIAVIVEAKRFRPPPTYIYAVSASYILFLGGWVAEVTLRFGNDVGWRTVLGLLASNTGILAMLGMWRYYRPDRRKRRHDLQTAEALNRLMEAGLLTEETLLAVLERQHERERKDEA